MERKILQKIRDVYFVAVAVMMYYFLVEYINVGLHVTFRHVFALILFFSAFLLFLYKPNAARGVQSCKDAFFYSLPLFVSTLASLFVWFMETVDISVIFRGLSTYYIYCNMFTAALAMGALLYVFGNRGLWYNLIAILIANLLMIATIIFQYGLGNYFSELITLIVTFAGETGDIIIQAEVHELAFCLGAYLIYMLYKPKKSIPYFILLFLSVFCFLSAFKRIAMIAIAGALVVGYLLKWAAKYNPKSAGRLISVLTVLLILILVAYIAFIKLGGFEHLEKAGINTSGRVEVYEAVDDFYTFSPDFLGNGIGYLSYQLNTFMNVGVASVHNDFLQYFIDLGFWGYLIWLLSMTFVRVRYFGRKGNLENAIITFMMTLYLIIVSSTDNTMNYPLLMGALAMLMMGNGYEKNVKETEVKLFGKERDSWQ